MDPGSELLMLAMTKQARLGPTSGPRISHMGDKSRSHVKEFLASPDTGSNTTTLLRVFQAGMQSEVIINFMPLFRHTSISPVTWRGFLYHFYSDRTPRHCCSGRIHGWIWLSAKMMIPDCSQPHPRQGSLRTPSDTCGLLEDSRVHL